MPFKFFQGSLTTLLTKRPLFFFFPRSLQKTLKARNDLFRLSQRVGCISRLGRFCQSWAAFSPQRKKKYKLRVTKSEPAETNPIGPLWMCWRFCLQRRNTFHGPFSRWMPKVKQNFAWQADLHTSSCFQRFKKKKQQQIIFKLYLETLFKRTSLSSPPGCGRCCRRQAMKIFHLFSLLP